MTTPRPIRWPPGASAWFQPLPAPLAGLWGVSREGVVLAAGFVTEAPPLPARLDSVGELPAPPPAIAAVLENWLEGRADGCDLPVALAGTAFQQAVWRTLREIPRGEVLTYSGLARAVGRPTAVRAVAAACAANTLAWFVPCHRVVASDGSLAGFRWGLPLKAALLERERAPAADR